MENDKTSRYDVLRALAMAGADGESLETAARAALSQAARIVGLSAAALYVWNEQMAVSVSCTHADSDQARKRLLSLEDDLFRSLRQDKNLVSAYLSFGGETPYHSFTLPLRQGDRIFGAVIGLQQGQKRTVVAEDAFLEALTAALAVHAMAVSGATEIPRDVLDKERLNAIVETAVTVNHEINNPLTAILGNVQLLLMQRDDLDEPLRNKLAVIEQSATKIRDVTQKLLRLTSARSVRYDEGTNMIDLSEDEAEEDQPES